VIPRIFLASNLQEHQIARCLCHTVLHGCAFTNSAFCCKLSPPCKLRCLHDGAHVQLQGDPRRRLVVSELVQRSLSKDATIVTFCPCVTCGLSWSPHAAKVRTFTQVPSPHHLYPSDLVACRNHQMALPPPSLVSQPVYCRDKRHGKQRL
jgi:hypothetical protein